MDRHWNSEGFRDAEQAHRYRERARGWMAEYAVGAAEVDAVGLEQWVSVAVGGIVAEGRVDRIDRRGDELIVVDYKTGRTPTADDARILLVAIFRNEKRYDDALALLDQLSSKYPKSYLLKLERASALVTLNRLDEAALPAGEAPLPATPEAIARGEYLARAGNCMSCHTRQGGPAYAGGRAIDTPFGAVVRPLNFHRKTVAATPGQGPTVLQVKAVLLTPQGAPISLVVENYSGVLIGER